MGKLKQDDSDNQMDVEGQINNNAMLAENTNKVAKKNKLISKSKSVPAQQSKAKLNKDNLSKDVSKKFAKMVNLKKNERSLTQKQQIFNKVVKGLHGQKASKKERLKSRMLMRRELRKALDREEKPEPKTVNTSMTMESEKSIVQKKKKQPLNQKAEVIKMRNAMGQSLSSLKNMIAQRLN